MNLRRSVELLRRRILCGSNRRVRSLEQRGPLVSFCFDDFPRTALTIGGSILRRFGVCGTYYVSAALRNKSGATGNYFCLDDLTCLIDNGHEIGSHTYSHISSRRVPLAAFCNDVSHGREWLLDKGLPVSDNFAYPYGEVTMAAKKSLSTNMASCRGIYPGINSAAVDLNLLRANSLYGGIELIKKSEGLILNNQQQRGWLIFYTHDVQESPSPFGCTPQLLEATVSAAVRHSEVVRIADAITALKPQTGIPV